MGARRRCGAMLATVLVLYLPALSGARRAPQPGVQEPPPRSSGRRIRRGCRRAELILARVRYRARLRRTWPPTIESIDVDDRRGSSPGTPAGPSSARPEINTNPDGVFCAPVRVRLRLPALARRTRPPVHPRRHRTVHELLTLGLHRAPRRAPLPRRDPSDDPPSLRGMTVGDVQRTGHAPIIPVGRAGAGHPRPAITAPWPPHTATSSPTSSRTGR